MLGPCVPGDGTLADGVPDGGALVPGTAGAGLVGAGAALPRSVGAGVAVPGSVGTGAPVPGSVGAGLRGAGLTGAGLTRREGGWLGASSSESSDSQWLGVVEEPSRLDSTSLSPTVSAAWLDGAVDGTVDVGADSPAAACE